MATLSEFTIRDRRVLTLMMFVALVMVAASGLGFVMVTAPITVGGASI